MHRLVSTKRFLQLSDLGTWHEVDRDCYQMDSGADRNTIIAAVRSLFADCMRDRENLGVVPQGFNPKLVSYDMDATCVKEESLNVLAEELGVQSQVEEITSAAMRGELDFSQSLFKRLALLKGCTRETISKVGLRLTLNQNIEATIAYLKDKGVVCSLVTGGFFDLANIVAQKLGVSEVHANDFAYDDGGVLTGKLTNQEVVDADSKGAWLEKTCIEHGIDIANTVAVGDGANDMQVLKKAGCAIGYCPKPVLFPVLDAVIGNGDHLFLKSLFYTDMRKETL